MTKNEYEYELGRLQGYREVLASYENFLPPEFQEALTNCISKMETKLQGQTVYDPEEVYKDKARELVAILDRHEEVFNQMMKDFPEKPLSNYTVGFLSEVGFIKDMTKKIFNLGE